MDRITGNTVDLGGGRRGFRDRNLALGQAGTIVPAAHLNAVQEELLAVIEAAALTPSASNLGQLLQAMSLLYGGGRLLNVQVFGASGTYTPTPGTNRIEVEGTGGGGGGGFTLITSVDQFSVGSGGASGSFAHAAYNSGFSGGLSVTIGAAGANGTNGTATIFGGLLTLPGGLAGESAGPAALPFFSGAGLPGAAPSGSGIRYGGAGQAGMHGAALPGHLVSGVGARSNWGSGGSANNNGPGGNATGRGAGGGGAGANPSSPAYAGGAGSAGILIIREYS